MGKSRRRAEVDRKICVSCGTCVKVCPAGCIAVKEREERAGS